MNKNLTSEDYRNMAMDALKNGNKDDGVKYLFKAVDMGNAVAMCNIGNFYFKGILVDKDAEKAFEWYKKAVDSGHEFAMKFAMFQIGELYSAQQNEDEAFKWYLKSAEMGANYAMN